MNDFTASNGVSVANHGGNWDRTTIHFEGEVLGLTEERTHARDVEFEDRDFEALREFFQAEADERLGRWRSKLESGWTAVLDSGVGYISFRHDDGLRQFAVASSGSGLSRWSSDLQAVAREYFDAHPEPKPWHEAVEGEAWALRIGDDDGERAWMAEGDGPRFWRGGHSIHRLSGTITGGRRIWPEVSE